MRRTAWIAGLSLCCATTAGCTDVGNETGAGGAGAAQGATGGNGNGNGNGNGSGNGQGSTIASTGQGSNTGAGPGATSGGSAATGLPPPDTDCQKPEVICVGGPSSEVGTLQEAADAAQPGDTVVVAAGSYAGFEIDHGGTEGAPITFYALDAGVIIDTDGPTGDGVRFQNVSDVRVEGFTITGMSERCIAARGATPDAPMFRLAVLRNSCALAGHEGFYLSEVSASLVEGNTITASGQDGQPRGHGIYLANAGADGTVIRHNHIFDITAEESAGIHMNGDVSVGGDGVIEGLDIDGNVLHGLSHNALNMDGVRASLIRNNVIYDVNAHAIRAYAIDGAEGPSNLHIVGNTIHLGASGRSAIKLTEEGGGHVVFDNVLLTDNENEASIVVEDPAGIASDANAVVDRFSGDGGSVISLSSWRSSGNDATSFLATESLFVAPGADYHLAGGSPAIDAGIATLGGVAAPTTDAAGNPRPAGGGFDIGAYESP